jgi:hypothetical protein
MGSISSWIDEILNIDGLSRFKVDPLKILIFQHDVLPLFVFVTFNDLVPRNLLTVSFRHTLVIDWAQVVGPKQTKPEFLFSRGRIKSDRNIDQTEADAAFPDCAHN